MRSLSSKFLSTFFAHLFFLSFSMSSMAESCSDILAHGIFNDFEAYSVVKNERVKITHMCREVNRAFDTGASYMGIAGSFAGSESRKACDDFLTTNKFSEEQYRHIKTASELIVGAWSACMDNNEPLRFSLQQGASRKYFNAFVRKPGSGIGGVDVTVDNAKRCECRTIEGVTCKASPALNPDAFRLLVSFKAPARAVVECEKKNPMRPVSATATDHTSGNDSFATLQGYDPFLSIGSDGVVAVIGVCAGPDRPAADQNVVVYANDFGKSESINATLSSRKLGGDSYFKFPVDLWSGCSIEAVHCQVKIQLGGNTLAAEDLFSGIYLAIEGGGSLQVVRAVPVGGGCPSGGYGRDIAHVVVDTYRVEAK